MTGIPLIVAFVATIVLMILAIARYQIHPFIAILAVSFIFALVAGLPIVRQVDGEQVQEGIADIIGAGFSGTFRSIGIVIILGALIGLMLEKTGAALRMADTVVHALGDRHAELAMLLMGWIVSIPVFCDSGFVILDPIRRALVRRTRVSSVATTVALSAGLYISHCFIPPTPGPIAAANTLYQGLGMDTNLLLVIALGLGCSVIPMLVAFVFAKFIGKRVKSEDELAADKAVTQSYEELLASYGSLPSAGMSFAPIVLPIFFMALSSALKMAKIDWAFLHFLGIPIIAISLGLILVSMLLVQRGLGKDFHAIVNEGLKTVGPILFVTAAGGVLGRVIANTSMVAFIKEHAGAFSQIGIFFPFILAAILKTAQGSSTVAITTTAGILAPLMGSLGLDSAPLAALTVIAIGAGAMTVSHANDSYFWVVSNFGQLKVTDGYKTQTLGTLLIGLSSMVGVFIFYLLLR